MLGLSTLAHGMVAAAAGALFEAAPLVFLSAALPRRFRAAGALAGCGCSSRIPGALAPAAIALCWFTFGPAVALGRVALAGTIAVAATKQRRRAPADDGHSSSTDLGFGDLLRLGSCAALAAPVVDVAHLVTAQLAGGLRIPAEIAVGVVLGLLAPCATAGVALAAGAAHAAPPLAGAILVLTGIVPARRPRHARRAGTTDLRFAMLACAVACAGLCVRGPSGLITPRLLPLCAVGAAVAVALVARRPRGSRGALAIPAIMIAALVLGSPEPAYVAAEVNALDGYPGERLTFSGTVRRSGSTVRLVRYAITCCRVDATAVVVPLVAATTLRDGTWATARGTLRERPDGMVLDASDLRTTAAPADPFLYR